MRFAPALTLLSLAGGCAHLSDQAIVDNCRAGGGLTVRACECVRAEMKAGLDGYSYEALVMLANGREAEAGARLEALTQRDQIKTAAVMMASYSACATAGVGPESEVSG